MKALIRGKNYDLTEEELDFVKQIYGYWEEKDGVLIFEMPKMLSMSQICKELGISRQSVHTRHNRNPKKYPLHRMGRDSYIFDYELEVWKTRKSE
mgnify:CR=1 FL=1